MFIRSGCKFDDGTLKLVGMHHHIQKFTFFSKLKIALQYIANLVRWLASNFFSSEIWWFLVLCGALLQALIFQWAVCTERWRPDRIKWITQLYPMYIPNSKNHRVRLVFRIVFHGDQTGRLTNWFFKEIRAYVTEKFSQFGVCELKLWQK